MCSTQEQNKKTGEPPQGLIVYSSKTGNTRNLAEAIHRGFAEAGISAQLAPVEENPDPLGAAWILLGFWADRGRGDAKALDYLKGLSGFRLGLFGTLGAYPDSAHAKGLAQTMQALVAEKNTPLGCFLCQGKIDPALTERFKSLPADHPHGMNEERMQRHREAAKHPDDADRAAAIAACTAMIAASSGAGGAG
ncbi:MAG: flavodoxin family protein [Treponema sp.]|jgi:flavodoxin|nr:flavodoxin family protein [Treponema sp.]